MGPQTGRDWNLKSPLLKQKHWGNHSTKKYVKQTKKNMSHTQTSQTSPPPQRIYTKKQSKEHSGPGPDTNTSRPDSCCCWIRAKPRCCLTVSTFEPATFERCNFCGKCQQNSGAKTVGALLIFVGCVSTKKTQIIKSSSSPRNFILGPLILRYTYWYESLEHVHVNWWKGVIDGLRLSSLTL